MIECLKPLKTKIHYSFICFDIEEFYPSISQDLLNRVLDLASAYDITNDEETSCNTCKTFDPYAQTATLAKESRYNIWRHNGQLRRCSNMRACRKPFLLSQLPHWEKQTTENMPRFFRRGVVGSCSVMVEEYWTIANWFLTTLRRKKSSSFYAECTGKLASSSTLIRPLTPKTHTRLQVYQEPPSDRLVKGIWRWHAKDDIYETF